MASRCRILRTALVGACTVGFACAETPAAASEPSTASLHYSVVDPAGTCASEEDFRRKVAVRLGYDPFEERAEWLFRVRIDARPKRPRAEIMTERGGKSTGKRELDEPTCEALAEAVASTVAIAIDPVAASPARAPRQDPPGDEGPGPTTAPVAERPAPTAPPPPLPPPPPAHPPVPQAHARARVVPLVYLDGTAAVGRTAGVALGGRAGFGVVVRALSIAAEARGEATPGDVALDTRDVASWSVFSGAHAVCGHKGALEFCGVGALGSLQARARDVATPTLKSAFLASLGVRGGVRLPLTPDFAFRANLELGIPLVRTTFHIQGEPVWTAPVVNGTLGIGVEARFE